MLLASNWTCDRASTLFSIPANDKTSKEVKSGERNLSFSKSLDHGNNGISSGADRTSSPKALVLSTTQLCQDVAVESTVREGLEGGKLTVDD